MTSLAQNFSSHFCFSHNYTFNAAFLILIIDTIYLILVFINWIRESY